MNHSVRSVLRHSIRHFGLKLAKDAALCDAYLSDLLPFYPQERRLLVKAVAEGIPSQVLLGCSSEQQKQHIKHLIQACHFSEQQAGLVVETWSYALQAEFANIQRTQGRQGARYYLGNGVITGLVLWGISSAIAVYQEPEKRVFVQQELSRQAWNGTAVRPEIPLTSDVAQAEVIKAESHDQPAGQLGDLVPAPYLPSAKVRQPSLERALVQERFYQRAMQEAARMLVRQQFLEQEKIRRDELEARQQAEQEARMQQLEQEATARQQAEQKAQQQRLEQEAAARQQAEQKAQQQLSALTTPPAGVIQQLIQQLINDSLVFGNNVAALQKKQVDLAVLARLFKLTHESYYQQQHQQVQNSIASLQQRQVTLSGRYVQHWQQLCDVPAMPLQESMHVRSLEFRQKQGTEAVAFGLLQRHVGQCPQVARMDGSRFARQLELAYSRAVAP